MSHLVCFQSSRSSESSVTGRATQFFFAIVGSQMGCQGRWKVELFPTLRTRKTVFLAVSVLMHFAHTICSKPGVAMLAGEGIFITVGGQMPVQMVRLLEFHGAILTLIGSFSRMGAKVHFEATGIGK